MMQIMKQRNWVSRRLRKEASIKKDKRMTFSNIKFSVN